jgi:hypothetical protein
MDTQSALFVNTVDVLGLGESLSEYDYADNIRIGVNDISSRLLVDYVVCVNGKESFTPERLKVIERSRCLGFYSQLKEWQKHPSYCHIELQTNFTADLNQSALPKSIFSPYVAVALAYKQFAPDLIRVFGVDIVNHHLNDRAKQIKEHWSALVAELNARGVQVKVYGQGLLAHQ